MKKTAGKAPAMALDAERRRRMVSDGHGTRTSSSWSRGPAVTAAAEAVAARAATLAVAEVTKRGRVEEKGMVGRKGWKGMGGDTSNEWWR